MAKKKKKRKKRKKKERQRHREALKVAREKIKLITYQSKINSLLLIRNNGGQKQWVGIVNVHEEKYFLYPAKFSFKNEDAKKTFLHKHRLRECVPTRSPLQNILKEVLQDEKKQHDTKT